ncbi:MAG: hypothetical protein HOP11_06665 [Saprospiraceae bacterium]|nr:hypothetical protein [Saprospiraceae bacterium]
MKKLLSVLILLFITKYNYAQFYFNSVIPSDENCIDGIYHPAMEISFDTILLLNPTKFRNKYSGTTRQFLLNEIGKLISSEKFVDSNNLTIPFDIFKINNSYIVCGQKFISKDSIGELWYAQLSGDGKIIWEKKIRTNYNNPGLLKISISRINSRINFCGTNVLIRSSGSAITSHGIVVITDSIGNIQYFVEVNDLDTTTLESYYGITEDSTGNVYACGIVKKDDLNHDAVIVKVSPDGQLLWRKQIPSPEYNEILNSGFPQEDGSILFVGGSANGDFFAPKFNSVVLMNMDTSGKINWTKRIYKSWDSYNASCIEDAQGNILCGGTSRFKDTDQYDGWICKFSNKGDSIWSRVINNYDKIGEQFFNIANASDGGYYLTGYSWIEGNNSSKAWIVKVDSLGCLVPGCEKVVATEDIRSGKEKEFVMFPNPVTERFFFLSRITVDEPLQMLIHNLQGELIQTYKFRAYEGHQYQLDLKEDIPSGLYNVTIVNAKGMVLFSEKMEKV